MDFWKSLLSILVSVFQHHSSNLAIRSIEWLITNNIAVQETVFSKIKISPVQIRFNFHSQSHIGSNNIFQELLRVTAEVRKNHYLEKKNTEFTKIVLFERWFIITIKHLNHVLNQMLYIYYHLIPITTQ